MSTTKRARVRKPRIGRWSNGRLLTPQEYDAIGPAEWDDRYRYELVHGVLIVSPPAGIGERGPNDYLGHLLWSYLEGHAAEGVRIATAQEQEVKAGADRRRADRAVWIDRNREPDPTTDRPTILVEFVSRSRRDRVRDYDEKRRDYLQAGVAEYWIIDRFARTLTVHRALPADPQTLVIGEAGAYETPLMPGFELKLKPLLEVADRMSRTRKKPPGKKKA